MGFYGQLVLEHGPRLAAAAVGAGAGAGAGAGDAGRWGDMG